jgi:carbonic anhydrase
MTKHLLSGHARFRSEYFAKEGEFLRTLARDGQNPSALYIGCSDSRVVPELLTSSKPGDLFVVRNIANVVPPLEHADASVGAAIDYSIAKLGVEHVIVCGHDGCGGVRAAIDGIEPLREYKSLHEWLHMIEEPARMARELAPQEPELFRTAVEENVLQSMDNLISYPVVAKALGAGKLALHGWVFDLAKGALRVYDIATEEFVEASAVGAR